MHIDAVSTEDDGFQQYAYYVVDELTRIINETKAYLLLTFKKPQQERHGCDAKSIGP